MIKCTLVIQPVDFSGLCNTTLNVFKNYTSHRFQSTIVNGFTSSKRELVTYGTAQGSVLGPLIYIIYGNDILKLLEKDYDIFLYT